MKVHIDAEEWFITAGLIGLLELLDNNEKSNLIEKDGLSISVETLDNLAEKYVTELITRFNVVERDVNRMYWHVSRINEREDRFKTAISEIRKIMNEQIKKVEKYYKETSEYVALVEIMEEIKNIKAIEDVPKINSLIEKYKETASSKQIKEKLTLNYAKAVVLKPLFGQTSILQATFNKKSTEEHIAQIEKDFIDPAKYEMKFSECLLNANEAQDIIQFLEKHKEDHDQFNQLLRAIKKLETVEDIKNYINSNILPCSFIPGFLATQSYEEKIFTPLALSKNKAINFHWDFDKKQPVPMSALARLIIFLSPFGLAYYTRKVGTIHTNDSLRFSGIVLTQDSFVNIYKMNNHYRKLRSQGTTFGEAIIGLLQESIDKSKKMNESFVFIEFHSDYDSKKTLLDYYHMPTYLVEYLSNDGQKLKLLHHYELRDRYLRTILKGLDPLPIIIDYLRESINNSFHGFGAYHAVRERNRILRLKEGINSMENQDKLISFIYYRGVELREYLIRDSGDSNEGETYRASGRKKLESIAYRLINSIKAGNKHAFMDTIFRLYLGTDLRVPNVFIDSFKDDGLDFETIGSAFIAGLLGQDSSSKTKNEGEVTNG